MGFADGGKEPACQSRRHETWVLSQWWEDSPGGRHGNPLQYCCLENPMDRGDWQATVPWGHRRVGRDWNSNTLATSCEDLTHWKRLWCWEGLGAGGERDNRGWDGWMASLTRWTCVWVNSRSWWWTGRPGMLWFMGPQRVGHDWVTELNWSNLEGTYTWVHVRKII